MAFPTITSITNSSRASNATDDVVTLPGTTVSGELLIVIHTAEKHGGSTINEGFTEIKDAPDGSNQARILVAYKIATGSDNDPTVTKDTSERFAAQVLRIDNWHGTTAPEISTGGTGNSSSPDPDSLTPSWGAADTLWIATFAADGPGSGSILPITAWPLPDNQQDGAEPGSTANSSVCSDELNQATLDPGTFTASASDTWISVTIAVRPAGAAADTSLVLPRRDRLIIPVI